MQEKTKIPPHRSYIVPLDYGNRCDEREFVRALLRRYDRDTLVGCVLFVNNNPYRLASFLFLNFAKKNDDFENWLSAYHPKKKRTYKFFFSEMMGALSGRGFNVASFSDPDDGLLDLIMSKEANDIYLIPDKETMNSTFSEADIDDSFSVFLSHSSHDKPFVDRVFQMLHASGIRAWYDRYEIRPGDSITTRINEGLSSCNLGLMFLSKHFMDKKTGWPLQEANYFFQQRIREPDKKFIVVNIGLAIDEIPPLLRDYLYIDGNSTTALQSIVEAVAEVRSSL